LHTTTASRRPVARVREDLIDHGQRARPGLSPAAIRDFAGIVGFATERYPRNRQE
jgi:hypothetical protein